MVWHNFYIGTPNEKQQQTIELLKMRGYLAENAIAKVLVY